MITKTVSAFVASMALACAGLSLSTAQAANPAERSNTPAYTKATKYVAPSASQKCKKPKKKGCYTAHVYTK